MGEGCRFKPAVVLDSLNSISLQVYYTSEHDVWQRRFLSRIDCRRCVLQQHCLVCPSWKWVFNDKSLHKECSLKNVTVSLSCSLLQNKG